MNLELLTIGLQVGKYFIATTLLVLIYLLLYRGKASFNQSRIFLLTLPFLAVLLSQWNITVYTPPTKFVEFAAPVSTVNNAVADNTFQYTQKANTAIVSPTVTETKIDSISQLLNANTVLLICLLIALLLLVPALWQCIKLLQIRKSGKISAYKGFDVVTSSAIPTPFSFYKTIFVNENLKTTKQEIILKHESWHIKHRHYIDVIIIEFTTRLFWFNPLLWWVRKELRSVCEFQTDKSVLEDGQEIYTYQTLILEEVMGQSSFLANGFNNSFTKKRFITMKSNPNVRLNSLRRILLPISLLLIFGSISFSIGKQKTEYIVKESGQNKEKNKVELISTLNESVLEINSKAEKPILVNTRIDTIKNDHDILQINDQGKIDNAIKIFSDVLGLIIPLLDKLSESNDNDYYRAGLPAVFNSLKNLFVINKKFESSDFSDDYMSTIKKATIIKSSVNLLSVKVELNKLKLEKSSIVKLEKYFILLNQLISDDLIRPFFDNGTFFMKEKSSKSNTTAEPTKEELDKERNAKNLQFDKLIQQPNNTNKIKKIKNFPSIKLNKSYSWRNFCNNRLAGYGQYIFNKKENDVYSGVQINSYWQTNWNVTGKFIGDAFVIYTPEPWNERWVGLGFDGKTIYGSFVLSGDMYSFEFDIIDTKKNELLFEMNVKPNE